MGLQFNEQPAVPSGEVRAQARVYRTGDGELVPEGDRRAQFLAYPAGDPVAADDLAAYAALTAPPVTVKAAPKPPNKSRTSPGDK